MRSCPLRGTGLDGRFREPSKAPGRRGKAVSSQLGQCLLQRCCSDGRKWRTPAWQRRRERAESGPKDRAWRRRTSWLQRVNSGHRAGLPRADMTACDPFKTFVSIWRRSAAGLKAAVPFGHLFCHAALHCIVFHPNRCRLAARFWMPKDRSQAGGF